MDGESDSEKPFDEKEAKDIIEESVNQVLAQHEYQPNLVDQWCGEVVEDCLKKLGGLNRSVKYVVNCIIMQKTGSGLNTASSCFWDSNTDRSFTYPYELKTMHCIVTVFALAI